MMPERAEVEAAAGIAIGDTFFAPEYSTENYTDDCDWCGGDHSVRVATGHHLTCSFCRFGTIQKKRIGNPTARTLTVGQIRILAGKAETKMEFMAYETGVGSGTVYTWGDRAFATAAEAVAAARGTVARLRGEILDRNKELEAKMADEAKATEEG